MKQSYKNKIRDIRQLAMLNKIDIQTMSSSIEKELEQLEKKIDTLESKYELTDLQEEKLESMQECMCVYLYINQCTLLQTLNLQVL